MKLHLLMPWLMPHLAYASAHSTAAGPRSFRQDLPFAVVVPGIVEDANHGLAMRAASCHVLPDEPMLRISLDLS